MSNVDSVSSLRLCDTVVTASLALMAWVMTGLNDASLPSKVMSVPCNVVTTGTFNPASAKMRFAFTAALAWGMA